jgi:hypothetical protein
MIAIFITSQNWRDKKRKEKKNIDPSQVGFEGPKQKASHPINVFFIIIVL